MRVPRPNSILSRLIERLPIASLLPTEAAEILVAEYPMVDATVTENLVSRIEGNSAILSLRSAIGLVQCGYHQFCSATVPLHHRDPSWISAHSMTIGQWIPMEETLFTCICLNLWRFKGDPSLTRFGLECRPGSSTDDSSGWRLMGILQILADVGSFVHYSSLSCKANRLQILATAFAPTLRGATAGWSDATASMPAETRREIGLLAARCLRLYGVYLKDYHKMFVTLLLDAATLAHAEKTHCEQKNEMHTDGLIQARTVFGLVMELITLRVGFSTAPAWAQEEWRECIKPIDAIIIGFAKGIIKDSVALCLDASERATQEGVALLVEFRHCQLEVLRGLSMSVVLMRRDGTDEDCSAVEVLQQLLLSVCNLSAILKRSQTCESNSYNLTAKEWCDCSAAMRVLHYSKIHLTLAMQWLLDEAQSVCAKDEKSLLFHRTFAESLCLWWRDDPAAWEIARVVLQRCLNTSLLSSWQLIGLLDTLYRASLSLSSSSSSSHVVTSPLSSVVEMRNSCLRRAHEELIEPEPHANIIHGLLHIGAAAARDGGDLFAERRVAHFALKHLLLPLQSGMRKLFSHDGEYSISSDGYANAALSWGAFWFVCDACQWAFLWRPAAAGAPGQCSCSLRRRRTADAEAGAVVDFVELFGPELFRPAGNAKAPWLERLLTIRDAVGADTATSDGPGKVFLLGCHQCLQQLPQGAVKTSHVLRVFRVMWSSGPRFFAIVPELPELLFRSLFESDATLETLDAQTLWEMCLFTCAREVARMGAQYALDANYPEDTNEDASLLRNDIYENFGVEGIKEVATLLCALGSDSKTSQDDVFVTRRKRILKRALELVS